MATQYPTLEAAKVATRLSCARWTRFLPSPGVWAIGTPEFEAALEREAQIMNTIVARFNELGGMTPEISKHIGW